MPKLPFIIREQGRGTRAIFVNAMREAGVTWKLAGVYNNIEAIKRTVEEKLGIAVVPRISIEKDNNEGASIRVKVERDTVT